MRLISLIKSPALASPRRAREIVSSNPSMSRSKKCKNTSTCAKEQTNLPIAAKCASVVPLGNSYPSNDWMVLVMPKTPKKQSDEYQDADKRRDEALRRALQTPPQPKTENKKT